MSRIGNPRKGFSVVTYNQQKFDRAPRPIVYRGHHIFELLLAARPGWKVVNPATNAVVHTGAPSLLDAYQFVDKLKRQQSAGG